MIRDEDKLLTATFTQVDVAGNEAWVWGRLENGQRVRMQLPLGGVTPQLSGYDDHLCAILYVTASSASLVVEDL
jgi:hypothetical protein